MRLHDLRVFGIPFVLSLAFSLSTMGGHPYWQDSGLYLVAVKELGVLYPPGFVVYLLLAKLWTAALYFIDFTRAVHLFSAVCAASAAGVLGLAARDLLRSRGPLLGLGSEGPDRRADWAGASAGALWACGYTFWFTGIYAKGYSFYYLVLALLLWRMIRADETATPREFSIVAAMIGLAWSAHPSAALLGPALIAFVCLRGRDLGWKGLAARVGVAAAFALVPSLVLLPIFVARDPWLALGNPSGLGEAFTYILGRRFTTIPGVFGWDGSRGASFGQFLWEEFLGVGLALVALGFALLVRRNRRLLASVFLWMVPYSLVTILFKIEGQHDCWFVAAWAPLYLVAAVGLSEIGRWSGRYGTAAIAGAAAVGVAWGAIVNRPLLDVRNYDLAESLGRIHIGTLEPGAVVLLMNDDSNALTSYLQRVRRERTDVVIVMNSFLFNSSGGGRDWYDEKLLRNHDFLRLPAYRETWARAPTVWVEVAAAAAFLNANASCGHPLYCEIPPPAAMIREGYTLVPAGVLWKLVPSAGASPDARHWKFPVEAEEVRTRYRRERGQHVTFTPTNLVIRPEGYERRLVKALLRARRNLADWLFDHGDLAAALRRYESIQKLLPESRQDPDLAYRLAVAYHATEDAERAEPLLMQAFELTDQPRRQATILLCLGQICRRRDEEERALWFFERAREVPGLDPDFRGRVDAQSRQW